VRIQFDEQAVAVREDVRGACEILGYMFSGEQLPRIC
jgi:hydrogenase maturation factor